MPMERAPARGASFPTFHGGNYFYTTLMETVARRRSAALLSEFGLGHVREYAPFDLILSALHLILRAKSQHICFKCARMALRATFSNEIPLWGLGRRERVKNILTIGLLCIFVSVRGFA